MPKPEQGPVSETSFNQAGRFAFRIHAFDGDREIEWKGHASSEVGIKKISVEATWNLFRHMPFNGRHDLRVRREDAGRPITDVLYFLHTDGTVRFDDTETQLIREQERLDKKRKLGIHKTLLLVSERDEVYDAADDLHERDRNILDAPSLRALHRSLRPLVDLPDDEALEAMDISALTELYVKTTRAFLTHAEVKSTWDAPDDTTYELTSQIDRYQRPVAVELRATEAGRDNTLQDARTRIWDFSQDRPVQYFEGTRPAPLFQPKDQTVRGELLKAALAADEEMAEQRDRGNDATDEQVRDGLSTLGNPLHALWLTAYRDEREREGAIHRTGEQPGVANPSDETPGAFHIKGPRSQPESPDIHPGRKGRVYFAGDGDEVQLQHNDEGDNPGRGSNGRDSR